MGGDGQEYSEEELERMVERLHASAEESPQLEESLRLLAWNRKQRSSWRRAARRLGYRPGFKRSYEPEPPVVGTGFPIPGFFIARDDEVDQDLVDHGPSGQVTAFEVKNMSPIEVATLGELLGAGTYAELSDEMFESARGGEGGECGLFRVAPEIAHRLADTTDVEPLIGAWGATDELSGWGDEDVRRVLEGLQPLAARARAEGRGLWVWWWI